MLDAILSAVQTDPLKWLFGGGSVTGVVVVLARWLRARPKCRVILLGHTYDPNGTYDCRTEVRVEVENFGREATSLLPIVSMSCRYPRRGRIHHEFHIQDPDRTLQPVTPRVFLLTGSPPVGFVFSHFRRYRFRFSRGCAVHLRVLNASGGTAGRLKFFALEALYVLFGALPHVRG